MTVSALPGARLGIIAAVLLASIAASLTAEAPPCAPKTPAHGEMSPKQMREWGVTMPRIQVCTSDLDCAGCTRCLGGLCEAAQWGGTLCMCDEECARVGQKSCARSPLKPLCGGQCSSSAPQRTLSCARGDDSLRPTVFEGRECKAPATVAAPGDTIVIELAVEPER